MTTIGIIGTMREEIIALKRKMIIEDTQEKAGMIFWVGTISDKKVVLVKCKNGQVSASVCTQILIDLFGVEYIVSTGVAGGLHPDTRIGEVIIASDIPDHESLENEDEKDFFAGDKRLVEMAQKAVGEIGTNQHVQIAHIVSEDQFVGSMSVKGEISSTFTTYSAEMEAAAIAHTCFLNKVPFIVIRTISDTANQDSEMNFEEFLHLVSRNASKIIGHIIEKI